MPKMFRSALHKSLHPSYWRFVFALRVAFSICCLAIPWLFPSIFHVGPFTLQPLLLGVYGFSQQRKFLGLNWKMAGRSMVLGCMSSGISLLGYAIPGVHTTLYGGIVFIFFATIAVELLTMAKICGLSKPLHITMLVVLIDSLRVKLDIWGILKFWLLLSVILPASLILSSVILWPRTAIGRYYNNASYVLSQITVMLAFSQRYAFDSEEDINPDTYMHYGTKVLRRLKEMDGLAKEAISCEPWVTNSKPLLKLQQVLGRGWFIVTVMKALSKDSNKHPPEIRAIYAEAFSCVYIQLGGLASVLYRGKPNSALASDLMKYEGSQKLRMAVREASRNIFKNTSWQVGIQASRFNLFNRCLLIFADYIDLLTESVQQASCQEVTESGVMLIWAITKKLAHHVKIALWDSWWLAYDRFTTAWAGGAWKAMIRNVSAITSAAAVGLYWYDKIPVQHGYWLPITVVTLSIDTLGQSFLKGSLRLIGVFFAWAYASIVINITYTNGPLWVFFLFTFTFIMAYVQQDEVFGYAGQAGHIAYYVICMTLFDSQTPPSLRNMSMRALCVALGVIWSSIFFLAMWPLDGMRNPLKKLKEATEHCYEAFDILAAHRDENVSPEKIKKAEELLAKASLCQASYELTKLHTGVLYYTLGVFRHASSTHFNLVNLLSHRIENAIAAVRLMLLVGEMDTRKAVTDNISKESRPCLEEVIHLVNDVRARAINAPFLMGDSPITHSVFHTIGAYKANSPKATRTSTFRHPVASATIELLQAHYTATQAFLLSEKYGEDNRVDLVRWDAFIVTCARAARSLAAIAQPDEQYMEEEILSESRPTTLPQSHSRQSLRVVMGKVDIAVPIPRAMSEWLVIPPIAAKKEEKEEAIEEEEEEGGLNMCRSGEEIFHYPQDRDFPPLTWNQDQSDWELAHFDSIEMPPFK